MEVTSVVKQSVILIFLYISNVWGYGPPVLGSVSYRTHESSYLQPSLPRLPHGSFVLPNVPSAYAEPVGVPNPYEQLSLPTFLSNTGYTYDTAPAPILEPSLPGLTLSLLKNTAQFLLSIFSLTDVDRHSAARLVADNINAILDRLRQLEQNIAAILTNLGQGLQSIPVLGSIVQLAFRIVNFFLYIPLSLFYTLGDILRSMFSTNTDDQHLGVRYAFA